MLMQKAHIILKALKLEQTPTPREAIVKVKPYQGGYVRSEKETDLTPSAIINFVIT